MPYLKSAARKDLEEAVYYYKALSKKSSLKKNKINYELTQCVYKTAIFQTSAALEEYIQSVFEDWITALHSNNKTIESVPNELVYWGIGKKSLHIYKKYLLDNNESEFIKDLINKNEIPPFYDNKSNVKSVINHMEFVRDRKYPSNKNISTLFNRFGMCDIFKKIHKKSKKDYRLILKSFSDKRTEIAHRFPSENLTHTDIKTNLHNVTEIVNQLDRILYSHVCKTSGTDCWVTTRLL